VSGGTNQHVGWAVQNPTAAPVNYRLKVHGDGVSPIKYKLVTSCCNLTDYTATPVHIPPDVYHFEATVNTCCATNPIPTVWSAACAGTAYPSGPDVIFRFTLASAGIVSFQANATFDDQIMVFTDLANPTTTCVASKDGSGNGELMPNISLSAGTYYVSVSAYLATSCGTITLVMDSDVPLPVELSGDLTATPGDGAMTLSWATAAENGNSRFDIVRNGQVVGQVAGAGISPTHHSYRFTDANLSNGTTYNYTLRAVTVNGVSSELATVSAVPSFSAANVTEYGLHQNFPNPFNPTTSIAVDLVESGNVSLKVYNLMGQEVASLVSGTMTTGRHIVNFDASNLSSGIYLYRLSVNGFVAEKKMLLMK
jgi:hypothetical protein